MPRQQLRETEQVVIAMHLVSATIVEVAGNASGAAAADQEAYAGTAVVTESGEAVHNLANESRR